MVIDLDNALHKLYESKPLPDSSLEESWRKFSFKNFDPEKYSLDTSDTPNVEIPSDIELTRISSLDSGRKNTVIKSIEKKILSMDPDYFQLCGFRDFDNGTYIRIPDGYSSNIPISLIRIISEKSALFSPFTYIHFGKNSKAIVVEELTSNYNSEENYQWLNPFTIVEVDDHAQSEYISIERLGSSVFFFKTLYSFQGKDSYLKNVNFYSGGLRSKSRQNLVLEGERAELRSIGLSAIGGREFWDHESEILHRNNHSKSSLLHKVVVKDRAHHLFTGNLHIPNGLYKVSASQVNHNLSLNPKARAESVPKLEIFAEDVQSSHGSTVGEISDEQLFYLKSRGLAEEEAKHLLVEAFVTELIDEVTNESVQERMKNSIKEIIWPS